MIWKFDACGFDFQSVQLSGIQPELYSVYQAAKAISTGSRNITLANLASPELVTDEAFHLIVCALLLAKYGDAILNFERRGCNMMMKAVLSNADHPEYGVVTIPLPVPRNQYDHCVALLEALEIGDASEADCRLDSLDSAWPVLNQLVCTKVNLDELDYLAKRLDSFDVGESSQFQVMAEKLNLTSMKELINLTFCCQQATVITDFTNLKEVGRDHYMNIHGGCASMEELEQLDGEETAILLIEDNEGTMGGLS